MSRVLGILGFFGFLLVKSPFVQKTRSTALESFRLSCHSGFAINSMRRFTIILACLSLLILPLLTRGV